MSGTGTCVLGASAHLWHTRDRMTLYLDEIEDLAVMAAEHDEFAIVALCDLALNFATSPGVRVALHEDLHKLYDVFRRARAA